MAKVNDWIVSTAPARGQVGRKIINVWENKQKKSTRMINVPSDAPEIDPYDKETGRGFMTPNAIMKSGISSSAKLMFSVLRSFICYNLGVIFPNEEQIEQAMSKERKANRKTLKELEKYGVIRIVKMPWQGHQKNYYFLTHEDEWNLPEPKQFSYSKNSEEKEEFNDSQMDNEIKEKGDITSKNFVQDEVIYDKSVEAMDDFFEIHSG